MKDLFNYLNFIITELKQTENKTLYDVLLFSIISFFADIFFLNNHISHYEVIWVIRYIYCSLGLLSLFVIRNRYYRAKRLEKEKIEQDKINAKNGYERARTFMVDKELDIITDFIKSNQPVLYLDNLQDELETLNTYKKLGIIEDSEISNGYIRIKFKKDFINIIKEQLQHFE